MMEQALRMKMKKDAGEARYLCATTRRMSVNCESEL